MEEGVREALGLRGSADRRRKVCSEMLGDERLGGAPVLLVVAAGPIVGQLMAGANRHGCA